MPHLFKFLIFISITSCTLFKKPMEVVPLAHTKAKVGEKFEQSWAVQNTPRAFGDVQIETGNLPEGLKLEYKRGDKVFKVAGVPTELGKFDLTLFIFGYGNNLSSGAQLRYPIIIEVLE